MEQQAIGPSMREECAVNTGFANDELTLLAEVLKEYLTDLRSEILDTDDYNYRQGLSLASSSGHVLLSRTEENGLGCNNHDGVVVLASTLSMASWIAPLDATICFL
jgi:hypothetical protein